MGEFSGLPSGWLLCPVGKKGAFSQFTSVHVCVTEVVVSDLPG